MVEELVRLTHENDGEISVLTLNNPPVNALSEQARNEFIEKVGSLDFEETKLLVITGERTSRGFSAGADLNEALKVLETLKSGEDGVREWLESGQNFVEELVVTVPAGVSTVAIIHGFAMGGGLELALACDWRFCVGDVKLALPESTIGILPGWGGTVRTAQLMGDEAASEFYESGRTINVEEAKDLGIVNGSYATFEEVWQELAGLINSGPKAFPIDYVLRDKEIEMFLKKVRPAKPGQNSPAIETIKAFLNKTR